MDLHAWITQQVDRAEADSRTNLKGLRVAFDPNGSGPVITGVVTGATRTAEGLQLDIARYGTESIDEAWADVPAIAAALRRCEADRRILARHTPQPDGTGFDDGWQCQTCSVDGGDGYQYLVPYPCQTVEDLAHAHGVTPDVLAGLDHPRPPGLPADAAYELRITSYPTSPVTTSDVPAALRGPHRKS